MTDELKPLKNIITSLHKNNPDKKDMIPTSLIDKTFRDINEVVKAELSTENELTLKYLDNGFEIILEYRLDVEQMLKELNRISFLNTLDFYRLLRCKKIYKDLSALISFYKNAQSKV